MTREDYDAIFDRERRAQYPEIDQFEVNCHAPSVDRERLERAARVLACPLKKNPPNWQHGRVIYSAFRAYLRRASSQTQFSLLDVGTAKGFSALMMLWAARDAGVEARIVSLDVVDPCERVSRNTVAEVDGPVNVYECLDLVEHVANDDVTFLQSPAVSWLAAHHARVHCAFVDGKHTYDDVTATVKYLRNLQRAGDVVLFDDLQIPGVARAVGESAMWYDVHRVRAIPGKREYAVAVRT